MGQEEQTHPRRHNHPNSDYIDYLLLAAASNRTPVEAESDFELAKDQTTIVEDMACKKP